MHKDFKFGLIVGIAAAAAVALWLCTRPKLSTESRILRSTAPAPSAVTAEPRIESPPEKTKPLPDKQKSSNARSDSPGAGQTMQAVHPQRFYIVQKGDTLSAISQKYYGSPRYWQKIFSANRNVLQNPDRLTPGTRLVIPE